MFPRSHTCCIVCLKFSYLVRKLVGAVLQQVLPFRFVISLNPISLVYRTALCLLCFDVPLFSVVLARLALY